MTNRRAFFRRFGGLIASVAIAQQVVREFVFEKYLAVAAPSNTVLQLHKFESICFKTLIPSFQDFMENREKYRG